MTEVLQVVDVTKCYGEGPAMVRALDRVHLTVSEGELVAIMGPSGSGKSTLLTIAGTLEQATSGDIHIGGRPVAGMSRNEQARLRRQYIGYVFQDYNLLAGLTAAENVSLPLELDGTRSRTARGVALAALDDLGLADKAQRFPDELSGGERQRVAIARAVVGSRRLLLTDEPTGALDSVSGEEVIRLVRAACKRGVAGVIVTHDAQLASWADRVVFLRDGRMVDQSAPARGPETLLSPTSGS
jgi:putative ABC transport system ATP-binding protein